MEYPESEELQEVYESLSQAHLENDLLCRELEGARAEVERLRSITKRLHLYLHDDTRGEWIDGVYVLSLTQAECEELVQAVQP